MTGLQRTAGGDLAFNGGRLDGLPQGGLSAVVDVRRGEAARPPARAQGDGTRQHTTAHVGREAKELGSEGLEMALVGGSSEHARKVAVSNFRKYR